MRALAFVEADSQKPLNLPQVGNCRLLTDARESRCPVPENIWPSIRGSPSESKRIVNGGPLMHNVDEFGYSANVCHLDVSSIVSIHTVNYNSDVSGSDKTFEDDKASTRRAGRIVF